MPSRLFPLIAGLFALLAQAGPALSQEDADRIPWSKPYDGVACRLKATRPGFDVDEPMGKLYQSPLVLELKNTGPRRHVLRGHMEAVRLVVTRDGRPVEPLYQLDYFLSDPEKETGYPGRYQTVLLEPGGTAWFYATYWGLDANFGSPNAQYFLLPGRYKVKAIFRMAAEPRPVNLETNTVDLEVTGKAEPLPVWGPTRPTPQKVVPAATGELSDRLRKLAPF